LKRYRVRGEWFRCSVSTATNAILCVAAAAGESGPCKARDEWIQEQARALVITWRPDWHIPTALRPRVDQLREAAKKKASEEAEKAAKIFIGLLAILIAGAFLFLFINWGWPGVNVGLISLGLLYVLWLFQNRNS
jgi:fatty acid desaturase